jgi:2-polyprenyl-6-methoxyphenol hydroxylase-like FAD-dependent oxidoreductase
MLLDKILVDAARAAGANLREDFIVQGVSLGERVTEVRGKTRTGGTVIETAPLVVGADGKRSLVARTVCAPTYFEKPVLSAVYYGYWDGLQIKGGELYERHRRCISAWPTNDGQTVIYLGLPIRDFPSFRSDVERNFFAALVFAGDLADQVRAARQVGRFMGSANLPNWFRKPYGRGWVLVGDAGLVMDPITGQGISHALCDAELVADAIEAGLGGKCNLLKAMRGYEKERNRRTLPMYKLTTQQARMDPPSCGKKLLYRSLYGKPGEIESFLGLLNGVVSTTDYLSPSRLLRLLGVRGIATIILDRISNK